MPRSVHSPATDQTISQFPDSAPFNRRHDNATSVIEPPYQLFAHRPAVRGTQLILTSPTSAKKSCTDHVRTSGLGSNASMANAYTPRLFLVQMVNMAYLLACFAGPPCTAGESVVLPSLEMPRSVHSPATDQTISQFPDSAPFNRRHDNATSVIEPPYQLFAHRPAVRGTQLILTSPTSAKKSCIDHVRTSGLGSNASMANAYTPRLFLVQ
ncbi:hypothetical protein HPB52_008367 [Rhipicephalus sanguineus]|uniref:Uncharacterized protein n=1 Tax=Rhipicephalus sanguineus TaxID=34632 RepID=A0A9D4QE08_RHISA|nr:hypothetical protein HPB52_008367 [Rhipicephalus sanguineus]